MCSGPESLLSVSVISTSTSTSSLSALAFAKVAGAGVFQIAKVQEFSVATNKKESNSYSFFFLKDGHPLEISIDALRIRASVQPTGSLSNVPAPRFDLFLHFPPSHHSPT